MEQYRILFPRPEAIIFWLRGLDILKYHCNGRRLRVKSGSFEARILMWITIGRSATKADRAALYHVARAVADTTNLSVEAIMEQAFGHKLMVGTDYLSNFRSGAIGRPKAKLIHAWIAEHHSETAHNLLLASPG